MSVETRVLALCDNMVIVSGMERITFEVLRTLSEHGAKVHCVLNSWGNTNIRPLVDAIGAGWSTGRYRVPLTRRTLRHPGVGRVQAPAQATVKAVGTW